jgi:hypothetical protein
MAACTPEVPHETPSKGALGAEIYADATEASGISFRPCPRSPPTPGRNDCGLASADSPIGFRTVFVRELPRGRRGKRLTFQVKYIHAILGALDLSDLACRTFCERIQL